MKLTNIFNLKYSFFFYFFLITTPIVFSQKKVQQISESNIEIEIPLFTIEKMLNEKAPFNLYSDTSFEDNQNDRIKCQIFKKSPFRVSNLKDTLYFTIPLNAWVEKEWNTMGIKTRHSSNFEVTFQIIAFPELTSFWNVKPKVKVLGFIWAKEPYLDVMGFDIPIASLVEREIKKKIPLITKVIDSIGAHALDFSEYTLNSIKQYSKPIAIDDENQFWLVSNPLQFKATPLKVSEEAVKFKMSMLATHQIFGMDSVNYLEVPKKLPKLHLTSSLKDTSSYKIHSFISMKSLHQMIATQSVGKEYTFNEDQYKIKIEQLDLKADSNIFHFNINISGDFNGIIQLSATPYLDTLNRELRIRNVDFTLKTKNILHKMAQWIFNKKIENQIENQFAYSYQRDIETVRNKMILKLNEPFHPLIENSGVLYDLNVNDFSVLEKGIQFTAHAKTKIEFKVKMK